MQNKNVQSDFLTGKVVLVTGSTSGIGRAIAVEMARCGAHVIVHGRNPERADQLIHQLAPFSGDEIHYHSFIVSDLADHGSHEAFVDKAWRQASVWKHPTRLENKSPVLDSADGEEGGVDIWVNNAGVDVLTGEAARGSFDEKLFSLWRVDVLATIRLSRLVAKRMKERGGAIINIGWDQAETGMAGDSGEMFAAIKGAVMAFTRSLAKSSAPTVRVNCVAPGWIKTKWGNDASDYWDARAVGESLIGRWGRPEDVARAVRFLASPDAEFINGQTLNVNGGAQPWPEHWPAQDRTAISDE